MHFSIITLFPETFPGTLSVSLPSKALQKGLFTLETLDLRQCGTGKHKKVDDEIYGGGPGMLIRPDVISDALELLSKKHNIPLDSKDLSIIATSAKGEMFTQNIAANLHATKKHIWIICGRFEGIDQRVIDYYNIQELSIGQYILFGGEVAAQVIIEAITRMIPGVIGNPNSIEEESYSNNANNEIIELEHPQYTKPQEWKGISVPEILLSGHHAEIAKWHKKNKKYKSTTEAA